MRTRSAALGLLLALLCVPLAPPAPASAHAVLVATAPARDAVISAPPSEVVLTFTEPIAPVRGRVQVLGPDGKKVHTGEPVVRGASMRIPVRVPDRPLGTYLVSYRVISADSHPVAGSFTYSAGAPSASPPRIGDGEDRQPAGALVPAAKYVGYLGLVLAVGPTLLAAGLWPRRRSRRPAAITAYAGLALVVAATAATWVGQAADMVGAPVGALSPGDLEAVADSDVGPVLTARVALVGGAAALLPAVLSGRAGRWRAVSLALVAVAGLTTWPLAGHPVASPLPPVSITAAVVHLAAMSVWVGGLVGVLVFLLRGTHERVLALILPAWSRWATLSVGWLVATGVGQAAIELGRPGALVGTPYGRLLLGKAGLLAAVLAVAAWQRRMVRRKVAAGRRGRVAVAAAVEVAATAVVLALTAALVQTPPGRTAGTEAARAAREGVAQTLTCELYSLQFDIYPVKVGAPNSLHAYVYTPQGLALPVAEWTVSLALPAAGVEPVPVRVETPEPNHGSAEIRFPVAGEWTLRFTVRTSDIDQATVTATVPVR
ncbi:copper resistance protein CopC [Micromonospora sp. KC606]|uniref:copper resistance CopC/CopD family protein n=1 Tax=Micromonospora sp. KC606 TaxID=2530379 RepID=UPI0010480B33|nr:copper resistance protein CopC [Micromonospora sp. KC606]TDC81344.1 copper resistance protein CopC [Micromonospora sp. KC606]